MQTQLDAAKADLLSKAAQGEPLGEGALASYLKRYYLHTAPEDLLDRDPADIYGAAASHYALAVNRPQGTAVVRVSTPTAEEDGWSSGHTVVEIVTDDMPFLVDSVTNELSRLGRAIQVVVHPQLLVRRDITGKLLEVLDADPRGAGIPQDALPESWMHIEIDRATEPEELASIEADLRRVLVDVREVVEDWTKMREGALRLADDLHAAPPAELPGTEVGEAQELLRWLADDHFTFLGYREYDLVQSEEGEDLLQAVPGTGLGVLRSDPRAHAHAGDTMASASFGRLAAPARDKAREKRLLVLTKANSRSTVHRPSYLDYVGVKKFDAEGNVVGERRFLGLLTASAYTEAVTRIPVVRVKVAQVVADSGFTPESHDARDLVQILATYPRDELFQTPVDELLSVALNVLHLQERRRLRLFLRQDEYGRYFSALVYLPRDRYTTGVRLRLMDLLMQELGGSAIDYTVWNTESVLARLHFLVRVPAGSELPMLTDADVERLEGRLAEAARSWADNFNEELTLDYSEEEAAVAFRRYGSAFPDGYRADFGPAQAVADMRRLESLTGPTDFRLNLYHVDGAPADENRFKIYWVGGSVSLSEVLPVLQRLGVEVLDEHPYELTRSDGSTAWVYDFGLRLRSETVDSISDEARERFHDAFAAAWTGKAENDGFNSLILRAGLTWRQAVVLRAYAKYLRQAGSTFSQDYVEDALTNNVHATHLLVNLFEARLSPAHRSGSDELTEGILEELDGALDQVVSLDEDRILRSFLSLIKATLRTNFFQRDPQTGEPHAYVSMKFDPQAIPDLPAPRPAYEIWVYSPQVEGVHLRFGKVARGGLRWSDRREDFRTEVLGLVKAQMVKNTVIVPVGSKGGFVAKQLPDPTVDRAAWLAEGISSYKTFICGLLDITDNLIPGGGVVPPKDVVRHDGDDTYLVVAADKGTATFSDIANEVAQSYGFWLGDAFASGGSAGYDHKGMGITAKGAWVSVERHFRELGHNTQTEDFSVVGIGDMSGDVFGNGMLLSEHIRLVAAFDHRHIFIDPTPDAASSFVERRRLFDLPRSSWEDYDKALISAGGGIFPRSAKSINITAQMRAALGIENGVSRLTPAELMKTILLAPVDLLWNGGIGTYVKATAENNAEVGDKANDAIRVNGADLRVKVLGEGGNLGATQLGRIEFATSGGPIGPDGEPTGGAVNTDAIDNSAGVDTSDHEVNIKILLNRVVSDGEMTVEQRNVLLAEMTDDIADHVLQNNYAQNVALANACAQAPSMLNVHARMMRRLVADGYLNRALEFLPSGAQLRERGAAGRGLTQPEMSVLLAYTKITLSDEILASELPDDPYLRGKLHRYFPAQLQERFGEQIDAHALHREIITTVLVNETINRGGCTFAFRLKEETGATYEEIVRSHTAARSIFDLKGMWAEIEALDNAVPAELQTQMRLHSRRLVERATRWLLNNRRQPLDIAETIEVFRDRCNEVWGMLPDLLRGSDREWFDSVYAELAAGGVPVQLAMRMAGLSSVFPTLDIVEVADRTEQDVRTVAEVYYDLGDRLQITDLLDRIIELPRQDRWQSMARAAIREDLFAAHAVLTMDLLGHGEPGADPVQRFDAWAEANATLVNRAKSTLDDIRGAESFDLANLSVAMRVIRTLLRTGSMR